MAKYEIAIAMGTILIHPKDKKTSRKEDDLIILLS